MKNIVIAILGEDEDARDILFEGFKKFEPDEVILLVKKDYKKKGKEIIKELNSKSILYKSQTISSEPHIEEVFLEVKKISQIYSNENIVINVDTDYFTSCLALSSAFVNGITAIGFMKEEIIVYPIMRFSYYNALNEKKLELLKLINKKKSIASMDELAKLSKMSLPLIAYHLRGNKDSKGLIEMNLVESKKEKGIVSLKLTSLGRLIISGIKK